LYARTVARVATRIDSHRIGLAWFRFFAGLLPGRGIAVLLAWRLAIRLSGPTARDCRVLPLARDPVAFLFKQEIQPFATLPFAFSGLGYTGDRYRQD
ncbi:MAG: hypothetical protein ACX94A_11810, partial [Algiphilus sp.]